MTLRIYEFISGAQIFPNKNTVLKQISLTFYWFIQDIYTILLSTHINDSYLASSIIVFNPFIFSP